jgi:hypothetical protein
MAKYIYGYKNWTDFSWQDKALNAIFGEVRLMQGKIIGQMNALGFSAKEEATLTTLTSDVVAGNYNCTVFGNWRCTENGNKYAQFSLLKLD